MIKKIINLVVLVIITIVAWIFTLNYTGSTVMKIFYTSFSFVLIYFFYKLILEETISQRIKSTKTRYTFRKVISILYVITFAVILFRIWIEDTQTLIVTYGLIAAGIAIALQDFFKNFLGGIMIFVSDIYTIGDRVEINKRSGDIIDIGVLTTTLFEIKEWIDGEQPTGRLTTVPNKSVVSGTIINYTKDNNFLWDEIKIPLKYSSNWKKAIEKVMKITLDETVSVAERASKEMKGLQKKYYLSERDVEPSLYVKMTDNWIELTVRYITSVRQRRELYDRLNRKLLETMSDDEEIEIASETLDITEFPEINFGKDRRY